MKKIFLLFILFIASFNIDAQQAPIMVCNALGTTCTPYYNLDTAIVYASSGNYIYIPGGIFPININIKKELHIIGAGHYPDSTNVTGMSQIANNIVFDTNSSNSSLEGLYTSTIISTDVSYTTSNIQIIRCNMDGITFANEYYGMANNYFYCNNCLIKDCISRSDITVPMTNGAISNCILGSIKILNTSTVNNCVFFGAISPNCYGCVTNSTFKNNIFDSSAQSSLTCPGCVLKNNLTVYSALGILSAALEVGTITNVPLSNLFVNATTAGFDYTKNFHLLSSSPGHNAGDDGTDVGIYGSSTPYNDGAVPSNPHVMFKSIGGSTDASGNLPVQIKVRVGN